MKLTVWLRNLQRFVGQRLFLDEQVLEAEQIARRELAHLDQAVGEAEETIRRCNEAVEALIRRGRSNDQPDT